MKEYVSDMVPKLRHAATKDVTIMHRKEEFVSATGQHGQDIFAAMRDAPTKLSTEAYVPDMVRRGKRRRLAAMRDVAIKYRLEEFVSNMVQR